MKDKIHAFLDKALADGNKIPFCDDFYEHHIPELCSVAMRYPEKNYKNHWGFPFDHNLIRSVSSYINASPMEIGSHRYIAAQGPRNNTFNEFWEMVWEEGAELIVTVTNEVEIWAGKGLSLKFHRFWPEQDCLELDSCSIQCDGSSVVADWQDGRQERLVLRTFTMKKKGDSRIVRHLHMENWPDNGVIQADSLIALSREADKHKEKGPIIVHCAAGVGRTGTFIAFHSLYHDMLSLVEGNRNELDARKRIEEMRGLRWGAMVASPEQYDLLITALREVSLTLQPQPDLLS